MDTCEYFTVGPLFPPHRHTQTHIHLSEWLFSESWWFSTRLFFADLPLWVIPTCALIHAHTHTHQIPPPGCRPPGHNQSGPGVKITVSLAQGSGLIESRTRLKTRWWSPLGWQTHPSISLSVCPLRQALRHPCQALSQDGCGLQLSGSIHYANISAEPQSLYHFLAVWHKRSWEAFSGSLNINHRAHLRVLQTSRSWTTWQISWPTSSPQSWLVRHITSEL